MNNIHQVMMIKAHLIKESDKFMAELDKVQQMINKKLMSLEKISSYKNEYNKENYLIISKSVPMLSQNLEAFIKQISSIIERDKNELHKLNMIKNSIIDKNQKISKKLEFITDCEQKILKNQSDLADKSFHKMIDDMIANQSIRNEYD